MKIPRLIFNDDGTSAMKREALGKNQSAQKTYHKRLFVVVFNPTQPLSRTAYSFQSYWWLKAGLMIVHTVLCRPFFNACHVSFFTDTDILLSSKKNKRE